MRFGAAALADIRRACDLMVLASVLSLLVADRHCRTTVVTGVPGSAVHGSADPRFETLRRLEKPLPLGKQIC
ncbi:MAG: hypothetical protein MZV70_06625 [Desulfobacterales bacterium]|nr:hypothetical protein [Desulfobacterales bacterium]